MAVCCCDDVTHRRNRNARVGQWFYQPPLYVVFFTLFLYTSTTLGINRQYKYYNYVGIRDTLLQLQRTYPTLIAVNNVQDSYGVASPGSCGVNVVCEQYYAVISNLDTMTPDRPEVFFSGCVHGDEQIGPTTTIEFARLLLENYHQGNNSWLKRLVDTRSIWIMPTANARGYHQVVRTENNIDPNRDFPYGQQPRQAAQCMRSTAARAINELYRDHLFQLALTFHGGMKAIAYEWGSPNHPRGRDTSPDHGAFAPLGHLLQKYASTTYYPEGTMNSIVYPVTGGMEDWAYAASWDREYTPQCKPNTYGGYPAEKTVYTSDMLRTFNILIETSNRKKPSETELGWSAAVLQASNSHYDGHIPRNIRLCLAMTDLVQPYVTWITNPEPEGILEEGQTVKFDWDVGGAIEVDETKLMVAVMDDLNTACPTQIHNGDFVNNETFADIKFASKLHRSMWADLLQNDERSSDDPMSNAWIPYQARYTAEFRASAQHINKRIVVSAFAEVDGGWANPGKTSYPETMHAQSHVIRARTVEGYSASNAGHTVKGYRQWYATPICYTVRAHTTSIGSDVLTPSQQSQTSSKPLGTSDTTSELSKATVSDTASSEPTPGINATTVDIATETPSSSSLLSSLPPSSSSTPSPSSSPTETSSSVSSPSFFLHISSMSQLHTPSTSSSSTISYLSDGESSDEQNGLLKKSMLIVVVISVIAVLVGVVIVFMVLRSRRANKEDLKVLMHYDNDEFRVDGFSTDA